MPVARMREAVHPRLPFRFFPPVLDYCETDVAVRVCSTCRTLRQLQELPQFDVGVWRECLRRRFGVGDPAPDRPQYRAACKDMFAAARLLLGHWSVEARSAAGAGHAAAIVVAGSGDALLEVESRAGLAPRVRLRRTSTSLQPLTVSSTGTAAVVGVVCADASRSVVLIDTGAVAEVLHPRGGAGGFRQGRRTQLAQQHVTAAGRSPCGRWLAVCCRGAGPSVPASIHLLDLSDLSVVEPSPLTVGAVAAAAVATGSVAGDASCPVGLACAQVGFARPEAPIVVVCAVYGAGAIAQWVLRLDRSHATEPDPCAGAEEAAPPEPAPTPACAFSVLPAAALPGRLEPAGACFLGCPATGRATLIVLGADGALLSAAAPPPRSSSALPPGLQLPLRTHSLRVGAGGALQQLGEHACIVQQHRIIVLVARTRAGQAASSLTLLRRVLGAPLALAPPAARTSGVRSSVLPAVDADQCRMAVVGTDGRVAWLRCQGWIQAGGHEGVRGLLGDV